MYNFLLSSLIGLLGMISGGRAEVQHDDGELAHFHVKLKNKKAKQYENFKVSIQLEGYEAY